MIIIFLVFSAINSLSHFNQRLYQLRQCAAIFSPTHNVPNECITFAKHGLSRNSRRLYSKSKDSKTCKLPCQKTRLYTKPKVKLLEPVHAL